ncbi:hypothetical protein LINPERPRIM_LOCUS22829, partial [Linum perenne]
FTNLFFWEKFQAIRVRNYVERDSLLEELKEKDILKVMADHPVVVTILSYRSFINYNEVDEDDVYPGFTASDIE